MVAPWQWIPRGILGQDDFRQQAEQWASRWRQTVASDWAADQMRQLQQAGAGLLRQAGVPSQWVTGAQPEGAGGGGGGADEPATIGRTGLPKPSGMIERWSAMTGRPVSEYSQLPTGLDMVRRYVEPLVQHAKEAQAQTISEVQQKGYVQPYEMQQRARGLVIEGVSAPINVLSEPLAAGGRGLIGKGLEAAGVEPGIVSKERMPYGAVPGEATFEQRVPAPLKAAYEVAAGLAIPSKGVLALADLGSLPGATVKAVGGGGKAAAKATGNKALDTLVDMYTELPAPTRGTVGEIVEARRGDFVRAWTDSGIDVSKLQKAVAKRTGGTLAPDEMMAELARLDPSKAAEVRVQALRPALQSVGDDRPYLSAYLTLVHDEDVARAMGKKAEAAVVATPLKPTLAEKAAKSGESRLRMFERLRGQAQAAGDAARVAAYDAQIATTQTAIRRAQKRALRQVTAADAARTTAARQAGATVEAERAFSGGRVAAESAPAIQALGQTLGPERMAKIQQAAQQVWDFNRQLLEERLKAGLISQELYDSLIQQYPHYSPTVILDYLDTEAARIARGSSISVSSNGIKRLTEEGTVRAREDPLVSTIRNAYQTEAQVKKNKTFNAFAKLWERDPELQRQIEKVPVGTGHTVKEKPVTGFVGGQKVEFMVPDYLRQAVEGEARAAVPFLGPITAAWRQLVTSKNPAFLTANAFLDASTYMIREMSRGGGPQAAPRALAELVKAYGDAFSGIFRGEYRKGLAEYLRAGGGMGGYTQITPKTGVKALDALTRQSAIEIKDRADVFRILRDILTLEPISAVSERIEAAPRVASFKLAERRGKNLVEAAIAGRTVTLDFQQGGNWAKVLNQMIPFFNVGMQAAAAPVRMVAENPRGAALTILSALVAPTVAAEAWNRSDPERARDYADVPQYLKDQGLVIMVPGYAPTDAQGNRHPQFLHIRTREFAPFVVATREIASRALGDQTRSWDDLLGGIVQSISPVGGLDVPVLGGPLIEVPFALQQNRDPFRKTMIDTERANQQASALSQAVGSATGQSPARVEYAVRGVAGGPGQMILEASDVLAGRANQRAAGPSGVPVVGPAAKRFVRGDIGEQLQQARDQGLPASIQAALRQYGVSTPSNVLGTIQGTTLTLAEQTEYQRQVNQLVQAELEKVLGLPSFQRASDEGKAKLLELAIRTGRDRARDQIMRNIGPAERKRRAGVK